MNQILVLESERKAGRGLPLAASEGVVVTTEGVWKVSPENGSTRMIREGKLQAACFGNNGESLAVAGEGSVKHFIITGSEQIDATTLAEHLGDVAGMAMNNIGDILAVGLAIGETWLLRLSTGDENEIISVTHVATLETPSAIGSLIGVHFSNDCGLLSVVGPGGSVSTWCIGDSGECISPDCSASSSPFRSSCSCSAASASGDLLALGNANGDVHLFELDSSSSSTPPPTKVVGSVNVSEAMRKSLTESRDEPNAAEEKIEVPRIGSRRRSNQEQLRDRGVGGGVEISCEILAMTFLEDCQEDGRLDDEATWREEGRGNFPSLTLESILTTQNRSSRFLLVVANTMGVAVVNLRTREVVQTLPFAMAKDDIFGSLMSAAEMAQNVTGEKMLCLGRKTARNQCLAMSFSINLEGFKNDVALSSLEKVSNFSEVGGEDVDDGKLSVVAKTAADPSSFLSLRPPGDNDDAKKKTNYDLIGSGMKKFFTLPPGFGMGKGRSRRRNVKSSGYGRPVDNSSRAMFRPKTNNTRAKKLNEASGGVKSLTPRGAQDDDAEAVGCCNNGNGRARWKKGLAITKKGEEEAAASAICRSPAEKNSPPPSRFCRSVRVWETSGAKTRLAFSTVASDGARGRRKLFSFPLATMAFGTTAVDNSTVRVFQRTEDLVEGREGLTLCHSDQVRGIDFSHSGDLLLTVGDADRTVKVWDWRKREVVVDIVSRKKKKKHAAKIFSLEVDNSSAPPIFPDVVVKSQFFYLDQFVLSSSGNRVFAHRLFLEDDEPVKTFCHAKTIRIGQCQYITAMSAVNRVYSHLAIAAGSDKAVRILDLNKGAIAAENSQCHRRRPVHSIVQPFDASEPGLYNIMATCAVNDGCKIWDVRNMNKGCVGRLDWPGSENGGRIEGGAGFSGCMRFIAVSGGTEDCAFVFDLRKIGSGYLSRLPASAAITDVAFSPNGDRIMCATQKGEIAVFEN